MAARHGLFFDFDDGADVRRRVPEVYDTLHRLHRLYDAYSVYENVVNVATINQSVGQEERHFRVEEELFALLLFGKNAYAWTEGKVNAAMGCVTSLWKEAAETGVLPSETALASAATHSSYDSIVFCSERAHRPSEIQAIAESSGANQKLPCFAQSKMKRRRLLKDSTKNTVH